MSLSPGFASGKYSRPTSSSRSFSGKRPDEIREKKRSSERSDSTVRSVPSRLYGSSVSEMLATFDDISASLTEGSDLARSRSVTLYIVNGDARR